MADAETESLRRKELEDLKSEVMSEATSPSEKAMLLVALEVAELRHTLESLLTRVPVSTSWVDAGSPTQGTG